MPVLKPYAPDTPAKARTSSGKLRPVPDEMTIEEFYKFPWQETERWELIFGVPVLSPTPGIPHQTFLMALSAWLLPLLEREHPDCVGMLGVDTALPSETSVLWPDLMVLRKSAAARFKRGKLFSSPPLLVVEVLSPSTRSRDFGPKRDVYQDIGVGEYWAVDPGTGALTVSVLEKSKYVDLPADEGGYVHSAFCHTSVRIVPSGGTFKILSRKSS